VASNPASQVGGGAAGAFSSSGETWFFETSSASESSSSSENATLVSIRPAEFRVSAPGTIAAWSIIRAKSLAVTKDSGPLNVVF